MSSLRSLSMRSVEWPPTTSDQGGGGVTQNVTKKYLKRTSLQRLLERLFPGQKDFNIRMKDDQWLFTAPSYVSENCASSTSCVSQSTSSTSSPPNNNDDDDENSAAAAAASQQTHSITTLQQLDAFLSNDSNQGYSSRLISLCQRNSWQRLQITRPMLELIASKHELNSSIYDLSSCFYNRSLRLEEAVCIPYSQSQTEQWIDISYTVRYPELKPGDEEEGEDAEWAIRQTGIYHRFNVETGQNLFVLLSPTPNSKLHAAAKQLLTTPSKPTVPQPFWLHDLFFKTHLPAWRHYMATQEHEFLPISNKTFSTYIDEPLRVGYDNLSILVSLEGRFTQITTLLASTTDTLTDLTAFLKDDLEPAHWQASALANLKNYHRQCASYTNTAAYLHKRTQTTSQLLANTLSYRDQVIAKEQNSNMLQLNKSAVFITTITLIYVPASFVATFFGMNFFAMDQDNSRIVGTSMIWIFVVTTLALTLISVIFYYWLVRHDGILFWRLAPKMHKRDWRIKRRGTAGTVGMEMRDLTV
ncbi:hypothetical protein PT974_07202 [Cladobotryum mycophilum]|uniref:CorA-like transporter domain-containing protein n=1 Tax=Cladobotryum mycophilum TaxID=491253 RepID=A0ABR0SPT1_9HYPO